MDDDTPLTERQQLMMAYIDDELDATARSSFERSMTKDPDLAVETSRFKNLMDLSRSLALSEPTDHELRRFWARFYNRTEWKLGWVLFLAGVVVLGAEGLYLVMTADSLTLLVKASILSTLVGGGLLLWNAVRLKLRTSHFDRYRGVMR